MRARDEKGRFKASKVSSRFDTERITSKKYLSGGYYEIFRGGQTRPEEGDNIVVACRIFLPCREGSMALVREIVFKDRCHVINSPLSEAWGLYDSEHKMRTREKYFTGEKWKQAFKEAEEYAAEELRKLDELIEKRHQALIDAEI